MMIAAIIGLDSFTVVHAYLDPSAGSVILQGILGSVVGLGVVVRMYWENVKALLKKALRGKNTV
jgi:ethanolamine utilization microcompartment shell protein EutS